MDCFLLKASCSISKTVAADVFNTTIVVSVGSCGRVSVVEVVACKSVLQYKISPECSLISYSCNCIYAISVFTWTRRLCGSLQNMNLNHVVSKTVDPGVCIRDNCSTIYTVHTTQCSSNYCICSCCTCSGGVCYFRQLQ